MMIMLNQGILKGKYHGTIDLLFDRFGISRMTTDNFCFYLQNKLIQTSKAGGQWYSDTSPFSIPWLNHLFITYQHWQPTRSASKIGRLLVPLMYYN